MCWACKIAFNSTSPLHEQYIPYQKFIWCTYSRNRTVRGISQLVNMKCACILVLLLQLPYIHINIPVNDPTFVHQWMNMKHVRYYRLLKATWSKKH